MDESEGLLDEVVFGSARGRPRKGSVELRVVRELDRDDIPALEGPPKSLEDLGVSSGPVKIRHTHHQLARLLATGTKEIEAAALTGYTPQYVRQLRNTDPAFKELVEFYSHNQNELVVEAQKKLHELGINALEELQDRLDTEQWTKRELLEMAELAFGKQRGAGGGAATPPVSINIGFVQPKNPGLLLDVEDN